MSEKMTPTAVTNKLREDEFAKLVELLEGAGYEVLPIANAQVAVPVVDCEGGEKYATIALTIPKGPRDGSGYNGHEVSAMFLEEKARKEAEALEKAKAKAAKLAKKNAKDA